MMVCNVEIDRRGVAGRGWACVCAWTGVGDTSEAFIDVPTVLYGLRDKGRAAECLAVH